MILECLDLGLSPQFDSILHFRTWIVEDNPLIDVNLKIFEIELIDLPEKEERKLVGLPFRN